MSIKFNGQVFSTHDGQTLIVADAVSWSDFARTHNINNRVPYALLNDNVARTMDLLKRAYAILGCHAEITSFYRSPDLNSHVGGMIKPPSAHMDGRAVDSIPCGEDLEKSFDVLKDNAETLGYDQCIIEHDKYGHQWLHLSCASDGKKTRLMAFAQEKSPTNRSERG